MSLLITMAIRTTMSPIIIMETITSVETVTVIPITMETVTVRGITTDAFIVRPTTIKEITMETRTKTSMVTTETTIESIIINMETTTESSVITMETKTETPIIIMETKTKTPIITMETKTENPIITMETMMANSITSMEIGTLSHRIIITIETMKNDSINTMETVTENPIIAMETTTEHPIITMETTKKNPIITMETPTENLIITMETTTENPIITMETPKENLITMEALTENPITTMGTMPENPIITMGTMTENPIITMKTILHRRATQTLMTVMIQTRPVSASSQEEEQTSFSNPLHNETADGMGRIIILQEQNEGLQQSLLKTAVRVECLGEEFMSSRHCLEEELQKTRMELSNLTERFKRLHDNCSSTQQTNSFLEHKLHLVSQNMEGERKRLNTRISALTERLADAKFVNNMDTGKARQHQIQSDVDPTDSPIAPPPAQFMDSMNDNIDIEAGQEQCLGSVPEEEESDWSEIGEETPRFVLMGLNRGQAWRRSEGDEDQVNGLGREKIFQAHSSRPPTVPQLQFTVHNDALPLTQTLSDIVTCQSSYKITTNPSLGSAVLVRSASLEEIPLPRRTIAKELRGTEAMMDLHHSGAGAGHDLDNEFIHHLKSSRETALRRDCGVSEMDAAMSNLQSAERILNHLISETQQTEAEVHGWSQAIPDELLKGERTKL
ncbi:unnamed protein product [Knipowitschia caucasica]